MNLLQKIAFIGALSLVALPACGPKKVKPEKAGERNDSCEAKNDCGDGLSCIGGLCQPTEFKIDPTAKECARFECADDATCCGDRPREAPAKCNGVDSICNEPNVPGCSSFSSCTSDAACNGGTCAGRYCSEGFLDSCGSDADCTANTCDTAVTGQCVVSGDSCASDADCPTNTCDPGSCDCDNPNYDPTDPICSDPDCDDICTEVCDLETNLCVEDTSCEVDSDCFSLGLSICTADGICIDCENDDECDADNNEVCSAEGFCERPCEFNQECGNYEECQAGECVYVGCEIGGRDCILAGGVGGGDARLAECVAGPDGLGVCRLPCDHDGHCSEMEVCDGGFCEMLGCETNAQCDRALGLDNQTVTSSRPYVTVGQCIDVTAGE